MLSLQNVLAVAGRVARPLNRFEMEPLLYDIPTSFGERSAARAISESFDSINETIKAIAALRSEGGAKVYQSC